MELLTTGITDEMLQEVYRIHQKKLGEGYLNYAYFKRLRDNDSGLLVAINEGKVAGYLVYEVTTDTEFFKSKHLDIESKGVPALCLLTMAVDKERKGVGTFLTKSCIDMFKDKVDVLYSPVWKSVNGVNADRLLRKMGFIPSMEIENYWYEESLGIDDYCPVCGSPCVCSLLIYQLLVKEK